ncbi:hypothetical protein V5F32_20530 [Xanthobacter oligotrophicus]|uniref:Asl1-like glycosyl hydrolase catalytic domain-containing protein n=1 Tax=Xanthobacter oligotrophicus TaxID=2607286 RepID=A0ABW7A2S4_9HYPH
MANGSWRDDRGGGVPARTPAVPARALTDRLMSWRRRTAGPSRRRFPRWVVPLTGVVLAASLLSRSYGTEVKALSFNPADPAVTRAEPLIIGANVHFGLRRVLGFTSDEVGLDGLAALGAESFRDFLPWPSFVPDAGGQRLVYSQRLMRFMGRTKLLPVLNLGQPNGNVPGGVPPVSDEGLTTFAAYLREAVRLTEAHRPIYEIWNEWNLHSGSGPVLPRLNGEGDESDPRAAVHYTRVAQAAVRTIREVSPHARIVVGAVGDDAGWGWTKSIVSRGALKGADGLSVHVYNHCLNVRDRTARELIRRVETLQSELKLASGGVETPIYITEFGWPVFPQRCTLDETQAAHNVAQFILLAAPVPWIKGIWVHSLKDVGNNPDDIEDHFGLFRFDNSPKPAVCFFREATKIVHTARSIEVVEPFEGTFVARVRGKNGRQHVVLWTSNRFVEARYRLEKGQGRGRLMCGGAIELASEKEAALTSQPLIIDFDGDDVVKIEISI